MVVHGEQHRLFLPEGTGVLVACACGASPSVLGPCTQLRVGTRALCSVRVLGEERRMVLVRRTASQCTGASRPAPPSSF